MSHIRTLMAGLCLVIAVHAAETTGTVVDAADGRLIIAVSAEEERSFVIDQQTVITVDGATAAVDALQAGQQATVTHEEDTALRVVATTKQP